MIAEIAAIGTGIANAAKALKTILETVRDAKTREIIRGIQDQLIDLQAQLLAIQAQYQALAEAKREIEEKLVAYENWDAEAARYELKELVAGIFVYALKADQAAGNPIHWLCPNCFHERKKSILQRPGVDYLNYACPRCKFNIVPESQF